MAVTVVGNTASELSGKKLSTDGVKLASLSRTDAQIKSLPSGSIEIVPLVTGKVLIPIWGCIQSKFAAGAYTNVHSGGTTGTPYFAIELNAGSGKGANKNYNLATESIADFTNFFASATNKILQLLPYSKLVASFGEIISNLQLISAAQGNIVITVNNAGDGNFTGGNAGNSMIIYVAYAEITVL